jgi:hypothetical protein
MQIGRNASSRARVGATKERRTPEQAFADAVKWRDEWREELESGARGTPWPRSGKNGRRVAGARAKFAAAMARAELKRFHWDAEREREFQELRKCRYRGAAKG